jgi:signal transduction histidine kinase
VIFDRIFGAYVSEGILSVLARVVLVLRIVTAALIVLVCLTENSYPKPELWFAILGLVCSATGLILGWRIGFMYVTSLPVLLSDVMSAVGVAATVEFQGLSLPYFCYVMVLHGFVNRKGFLVVAWSAVVISGAAILVIKIGSGTEVKFVEFAGSLGAAGLVAASAHVSQLAAVLLKRNYSYWSRLVVLATDQGRSEERLRLAQDMHDLVVKDLHGSLLLAETLIAELDASNNPLTERAQLLAAGVSEAMQSSRRLTTKLRSGGGLDTESVDLVSKVAVVVAHYPELNVLVDISDDVSIELAGTYGSITRAITELLENVDQHAHATRAEVSVFLDGSNVVVSVGDDGVGMKRFNWRELEQAGHFGLVGLKEQVEARGGGITVTSEASGRNGTLVEAWFPVKRRLVIE